jgi:hypothetical protein
MINSKVSILSSCNEVLERMWKNKKYFNPDVFAKWHIRVNFFRQGDATTWISLEILNINARTFAQHTTIFKSTFFYSRVHPQRKNLKTIISTRQPHKVSHLQQLHSYCRCMILQIAAMSDNHTKSLADLLAFNQHFADTATLAERVIFTKLFPFSEELRRSHGIIGYYLPITFAERMGEQALRATATNIGSVK